MILPSPLELTANLFNTASVVLAGKNSRHTWWTGIVGCLLFAWVFHSSRLYADVTLQIFFIITCILGWRHWLHGNSGHELPVRHARPGGFALSILMTIIAAAGYGWILNRFTNAFAPFFDSIILTFSILGQILLMGRRYESWWCWLLVNTLAVPLYWLRGLHLTSLLYAVFWVNAVVALIRWRRLIQKS